MCVYHSLGVALVSRSICICCYLDLCSKLFGACACVEQFISIPYHETICIIFVL